MKGVILAGGKGARLAPYTRVFPKPMMPIGDMTILEVLLAQLKRAGITDIVITTGHMAGLLRAFFQDGSQYGINIQYSHERSPLGTAGPLSLIEGLNETFVVLNGDVLTTLDFKELISYHRNQKDAIATIASSSRRVHIELGVIETDTDYCITDYIEKPNIDYLVSMGIYVFEPEILEFIPKGEYLDFPDLVSNLLEANKKIAAYKFNGYYRDLGQPDDYDQACVDFEQMRSQFLKEEA